jgi:hypothetical protein
LNEDIKDLFQRADAAMPTVLAAVANLGELLHRVDELHKVIAGNVEHSIAAWIYGKANMLAEHYRAADVAEGHVAWEAIKIIQALAHGVENGAWKA